MIKMCFKRVVSSCFKQVVVLMAMGITSVLHAADGTWTNTAGGVWSNVTNWNNEVVASGMDFTADFSTLNLLNTVSVNVDAPTSIGTLLFGDTDIGSSGWYNVYNNGSETNTLAVTNVVVNPFAATAGVALYPILQGSGALVKSGTGRLVLVNTNTYSGGTFVNQGSLRVGNGGTTGSIGTGPVAIASGANLYYDFSASGTASLPFGSAISGSGDLTAVAGKVWINGDITLGGAISLTQNSGAGLYNGIEVVGASPKLTAAAITLSGDAGKRNSNGNTLSLDTSAVNGPINLNISLGRDGVWYQLNQFTANAGTGTVSVTGTGVNNNGWRGTPVTLSGAVDISANVASDVSVTINATTNSVISGLLSGTLTLNKTGPGTLTLSGSRSTYSGPTTISQGTVKVVAPILEGVARHFDASTLSLANGAAVTQWNDLSGNAAHATVPTDKQNGAPTYTADAGTGTGLGAVTFLKNSNAYNSQALKFTRDAQIRSVFSVFKGNSFLLTDTDQYHFHRPGDDNPADTLFDGNAAAQLRGGVTYVNRVQITPTSYAMPTSQYNGFNLVEIISSGAAVQADSFNKDRVYHAGNQSQAEVLMFDTVVSEARRLQIEAYLSKKWFGIGEGAGNVLSTNSAVTLANGSTLDLTGESYQALKSLSVADISACAVLLNGTKLAVGDASSFAFDCTLRGSGTFVKQGAGTLSVFSTNAFTGAVEVKAGTLKLVGMPALQNPVPGAVRHFDASTLRLVQGTTVAQWNDLSTNNAHALQPTDTYKPVYEANALGLLGAVHCTKTNSVDHMKFTRVSTIRTVFSVFKGSSFLLTDDATYNFHRSGDVNPADPLWASNAGWASDYIKNGSTYVNGALVNGISYAMPTNSHNGFNLVEVLTTGPVQAGSINNDRSLTHSGDQQHAEIIMYDFLLNETQRLAVEDYLTKKWFEGLRSSPFSSANPLVLSGGILDPAGGAHSFGTLTVTNNSTISLGSSATLTFAESSGKPWSGTLTLTGTLGPQTLRFGTSSSALTYEQQRKITLDGKPVRLDGNGYAFKVPDGTRISFQ
jgi:autotransporter-associated beta strand protein